MTIEAIVTELRTRVSAKNAVYLYSSLHGKDHALQALAAVRDAASLNALFVPTGDLQELSMDSGWSDRFMELAAASDALLRETTA